jgi:UDPglucose--hexose-1-phosphate uridylyltransferase
MTAASPTYEGVLSDGRAIRYYGDVPDGRPPDDPRGLPAMAIENSLRHDPLHDENVMVAAARQDRTLLPARKVCPLCPSTPGNQSEIPASDYEVVVFENRFPSFGGRTGGVSEVVCFTAEHEGSFAKLSGDRARLVVDAWADRTRALYARSDVQQVVVFENRGEEIGVTLHHPHGQIYALPMLTPRTRRMLDVVGASPGVIEKLVADELAGPRVIVESTHWVAFVPAHARWPTELHIYPLRRVADLSQLSDVERDELASLYLDCLQRLDRLYDIPLPYMSAWHQAPADDRRDLAWLRCEVVTVRRAKNKLKYLASSESIMNAFVNDIPPEEMAIRLREIGP